MAPETNTSASSSPPSATWTIVPQGDRTMLLVFGNDISVDIGRQCALAATALRQAQIAGISDIVPSFNTVALHYQPLEPRSRNGFLRLSDNIEKVVQKAFEQEQAAPASKQIDIPVCYGGEYGPDLAHVANTCGLTETQVVELHSGVPAYVFMLGFAPGAPYIGLHDPRLAIGRRSTPRTVVPPGSVAIANLQTMIYPNASPGGWQIIGATPVRLFDPAAEPPALLTPGDSVRFIPIDEADFRARQGRP